MTVLVGAPVAETARVLPRKRGVLYAWFIVVFLMVLYTSSLIDRTILSLLVKPIRADLHLSDTEYQLPDRAWRSSLLYTTAGDSAGLGGGSLEPPQPDRDGCRRLVDHDRQLRSGQQLLAPVRIARRSSVSAKRRCCLASYSLISEYFPPERPARPLSVFSTRYSHRLRAGTDDRRFDYRGNRRAIGPVNLPITSASPSRGKVYF